MAQKFLKAQNAGDCSAIIFCPDPAFRKEFYFFYGSLMDSETLAKVVKLGVRPELRPAKIIGYKCMLWGQYPALLDGKPGEPVHGMAYQIQSPHEKQRLQAYESDNYRDAPCLIELHNGNQVEGRTFKWQGEPTELRVGSFDLKEWQMNKLDA